MDGRHRQRGVTLLIVVAVVVAKEVIRHQEPVATQSTSDFDVGEPLFPCSSGRQRVERDRQTG